MFSPISPSSNSPYCESSSSTSDQTTSSGLPATPVFRWNEGLLVREPDESLFQAIQGVKEALDQVGIPPDMFLKSSVYQTLQFILTSLLCRCTANVEKPLCLELESSRAIIKLVELISSGFLVFEAASYMVEFDKILPGWIEEYRTLLEKMEILLKRDPLGSTPFYSSDSERCGEKSALDKLLTEINKLQEAYTTLLEKVKPDELNKNCTAYKTWFNQVGTGAFGDAALENRGKRSWGNLPISLSAYQSDMAQFRGVCKDFASAENLGSFFLSYKAKFIHLFHKCGTEKTILFRPIAAASWALREKNESHYKLYLTTFCYRWQMNNTSLFLDAMYPYRDLLVHTVLSMTRDSYSRDEIISVLEQLLNLFKSQVNGEEPLNIPNTPFFQSLEIYFELIPVLMEDNILRIEEKLGHCKAYKGSGIELEPIDQRLRAFSLRWIKRYEKSLEKLYDSEEESFIPFLDKVASYSDMIHTTDKKPIKRAEEVNHDHALAVAAIIDPVVPLYANLAAYLNTHVFPLEILFRIIEPWEHNIHEIRSQLSMAFLDDLEDEPHFVKKSPKKAKPKSKARVIELPTEESKVQEIRQPIVTPPSTLSQETVYRESISIQRNQGKHKLQAAYYRSWAAHILYLWNKTDDLLVRKAFLTEFVHLIELAGEQSATDLVHQYSPTKYDEALTRHDVKHRLVVGGFATKKIATDLERLGTSASLNARYRPKEAKNEASLLLNSQVDSPDFLERATQFFEDHFDVYVQCLKKAGEIPQDLPANQSVGNIALQIESQDVVDTFSLTEDHQRELIEILERVQTVQECVEIKEVKWLLDELTSSLQFILRDGFSRKSYPIWLQILFRTTEYSMYHILKNRLLERSLKRESEFFQDHLVHNLFATLYGEAPPLYTELKREAKHKGIEYFDAGSSGEELQKAADLARLPSHFKQNGVSSKPLQGLLAGYIETAQKRVLLLYNMLMFNG